MNEQRIIKAYSYTEQGDYKAMWRPDLCAAFYERQLKDSDEPQFLYEVTIPFPVYADVSFHGAWLVYVKFAFLECEDTPVFTFLRREGVDGIVFKKIRIKTSPACAGPFLIRPFSGRCRPIWRVSLIRKNRAEQV